LLDCVQIWCRLSSHHRRYTANVQGQRSRSQHKVMYHQQKNAIIWQRIGSATSNLAWRCNLSGKVLALHRVALSCNVFANVTFSSFINNFFTALHGMQMRSNNENSVRVYVCQTRALRQNGRKICPDFYLSRFLYYAKDHLA